MKRLMLAGLLALGVVGCGASSAPPPSAAADAGRTVQATSAASPALADDLQRLREEQKLARDVYAQLHARWNLVVFDRIAASEQRHMDHVATLLGPRAVADPVVDDSRGTFADPEFARLFREFTAAGGESEVAALRVAAAIEDMDIHDLDAMLTRTDDPEVTRTYELLRCGSENHMRAYASQLQSRGEAYVPQYVDAATYDAILQSGHQRCGRLFGAAAQCQARGAQAGRARPCDGQCQARGAQAGWAGPCDGQCQARGAQAGWAGPCDGQCQARAGQAGCDRRAGRRGRGAGPGACGRGQGAACR